MTMAAAQVIPLAGKDQPPLAERLAAFLRAKHPRDTVSHVSRALEGVNVGLMAGDETIKKWVAGKAFPWPGHLDRIIAAYGKDAVVALFGAHLLTHEEQAELEISRAEAALARRRADLEHARRHRRDFLGLA